jgi:Rhs element Vgr protein
MPEPATIPTARSPDLATFTLLVEGEPAPPELHLLTAEVSTALNRVPVARFTFRDGDAAAQAFALSEAETFAPGAEVELRLGYHGEEEPVFRGVVTRHGIEARAGRPSRLLVECRHAAFRLTLSARARQFTDQTDADLAAVIAAEAGLAADFAASDVTHLQMVQWAATDWDFLLLRARANGLVMLAGLDGLTWFKPDPAAAPALTLAYGGNLELFEGELEARTQPVSVTARGWDPAGQEAVEAEAESAPESAAGVPDAAALAAAAGDPAGRAWHAAAAATDELQAWAAARLQRARLAKLRGRARCQGFAGVAPGGTVAFEGLGARFNGAAFVAGVRHEFVQGLWKTDLQLGLDAAWLGFDAGPAPAAGLLPSPAGLHVGVVRGLEDPDGAGRILVQLPVFLPEGEGLWARLATLEAGEERGFVFRPEIGDEVVVGFFGDDPRHPVILGALHGGAHPAPLPAADDNNEKGYFSRGKLKLHFAEDKKVLTLATEAGNTVILSEEDQGITIQDQNGNKLVLGPDGIEITSVKEIRLKAATDVKAEGVNVEAKASAAAKLEGGAGATLSSSGQTAVRGSIVQIN